MIMDRTIIIVRNIMNFMLYINRTMGVIFCHVRISKQFIQLSPSITSGNQKWNGAIPIFVSRAEFIVRIVRLLISKFIGMFFLIIITIIEARIIVDAIACTIKYLIDDSVDKIFFWFCIKGIIDKRLISNPSHIPSQE